MKGLTRPSLPDLGIRLVFAFPAGNKRQNALPSRFLYRVGLAVSTFSRP